MILMNTNKKVFIIAEAGVNHNGSLRTAKRMVDVAVMAGADAIKFQTFKVTELVSATAPKAEYQKKNSGADESQYAMLKRLELSRLAHRQLIAYCKKLGIIFLSTPFDLDSIDFLDRLGLKTFKIGSGELNNLPYLRKIGKLKKKIILSTGMAYLREVRFALGVLTRSGSKLKDITVLHCTSEYPVPINEVNLRAILTLKKELGVKVGYSDHTSGIEVAIAAVALGASVVEKHFTLDKSMDGPDHAASLDPGELKAMVGAIRDIEKAFGSGIKRPMPSEMRNIQVIRKSIYAFKDIQKGEFFSEANLTVKRPATGLSPMKWDSLIGTAAKKRFAKDEIIRQ